MSDNEFSGTCPTCGQRYCGRKIERLLAALEAIRKLAASFPHADLAVIERIAARALDDHKLLLPGNQGEDGEKAGVLPTEG